MIRPFLDEHFLLKNRAAERLYHEFAAHQPIIDYHNHLIPQQVAQDIHFDNLAELWLAGDHYKWRQMRTNGIPENKITGRKPDWSTFQAWSRTVPSLIGNPLYHWTHLELQRYFDVHEVLSEATAPRIWEACNARIQSPEFSVSGLLQQMNVEVLCTTDDPADSLEHHIAYARTFPEANGRTQMFPTFRPDKALALEQGADWRGYLQVLGESAGVEILGYRNLLEALDGRHAFFHQQGCRLSDHALRVPPGRVLGEAEAETVFAKAWTDQPLSREEQEGFQGSLLREIGFMNHERGWTLQLHMGALRNLNTNQLRSLGPDTGYDAISDLPIGHPLAMLLDGMARENRLPRVILYGLNPNMNDVLTTILGCFQDGSTPGKLQLGSAWWFNDHIDGMEKQLTALASNGMLARFVGMLTDSRSFLSFPRHEYFRRILCNLLGTWMESGRAPYDFKHLGGMVADISYHNASAYFEFPK